MNTCRRCKQDYSYLTNQSCPDCFKKCHQEVSNTSFFTANNIKLFNVTQQGYIVSIVQLLFLTILLFGCSEAPGTERLIFTLSDNSIDNINVSEDGNHWCYRKKKGNAMKVEGDRNYSPSEYANIGNISFAGQTGRCGFWAVKGRSIVLVVDGIEYMTKSRSEGFFKWSQDGKHWTAVFAETMEGNKITYVVFFDGKEIGRYSDIKGPVFSRDSAHLGYLTADGNTIKVTIDGKEKEMGYSKEMVSGIWYVSPLSFLNGGELASILPKAGTERHSWGDSWAVIKADKTLATYPRSEIHLMRGSTRIKLSAKEGKSDENLPTVAPLSLVVNEAGNAVAWWARPGTKGTEWFCYLDGKKIGSRQACDPPFKGDIAVSPNGKRAGFRMRDCQEKKTNSGSVSASIDGKTGKKYDWLGGIKFSPDSSRYAYWAKKINGSGFIYVVDGKEIGAEFEDVTDFKFSADSKHFAYIGTRGNENYLILDGKEHKTHYDSIWGLRLLPKGRPAIFGKTGNKVFLVEGIPTSNKR